MNKTIRAVFMSGTTTILALKAGKTACSFNLINAMASTKPRYLELHKSGELRAKAKDFNSRLTHCNLCPRQCGVDRTKGEMGFCKTGTQAVIAGYDAHFGEEAPLVGENGSGTIFITHCNLLCNFCQNDDISHHGVGQPVSDDQLADMMLSLQSYGCHNINFVTPTHVVPQLLSALCIAADRGLYLPLVYNSSGYDASDTLKRLAGVIDIYMPDFKFWNPEMAEQTCKAPDYPDVAKAALVEMQAQVGELVMDKNGLAVSGLLVRHLVMPDNLASTEKVMAFIANRISPNTYVNVMSQYRPCCKASQIKGLDRAITVKEYETALQAAMDAGIRRLDQRRRAFVRF